MMKIVAVVFASLLALVLARFQSPIPTGSPANFWENACGIDPHEQPDDFPYARSIGIFPARDGWQIYFYQGHHGRHVFKVATEQIVRLAADPLIPVRADISVDEYGFKSRLVEDLIKRQEHCQELRKQAAGDPYQLVSLLNKSAERSLSEEKLASFDRQWRRYQRYWITVTFEFCFLMAWFVFTFLGGSFGKFNRSKTTRLALSPLIVLTPHFLGYAPYILSFGPPGGIVYPLFALLADLPFFWLPTNSFDIALLNLLPKPLLHISQIPASPMAMSFTGSITPTGPVLFALIVGLAGWRSARRGSSAVDPVE